MRFVIVPLMVALAGCAASEAEQQRFAQGQQDRMEDIRRTCLSYGFQAGTPEFAQCVQTESNARYERRGQEAMQRRQGIIQLGVPR